MAPVASVRFAPLVLLTGLALSGCGEAEAPTSMPMSLAMGSMPEVPEAPAEFSEADKGQALVGAAIERTSHDIEYVSDYVSIDYPGGDVPEGTGVCTDVVIRSYRALGIDLQQQVHEDMAEHFDLYPPHWGLEKPDTNIDHRRVPNLQTFFTRKGEALPKTENSADYAPGDLVTWNVGKRRHVDHIGIVVEMKSQDGERPLVVHNIGAGPVMEDVLFSWPITGHYRYLP